MPDSDTSDLKFVLERLEKLDAKLTAKIDSLHTPLNCPLAPKLNKLERVIIFWKGGLAMLVLIGGLSAGTIGAFIVSWIRGR